MDLSWVNLRSRDTPESVNVALMPSANGCINHLRAPPLAKRLAYGHICFSFTDHAKRLPSGLEHRTTA